MNYKRLKTGVHVIATKGSDGITRYTAVTQSQFNLHYKHNVWWSKLKQYLSKLNIQTLK